MKTLFNEKQLQGLRNCYAQFERIDPATNQYKNLIEFLNGLDQIILRQIAGAEIKFLSRLAKNRVEVLDEMYLSSKGENHVRQ
jgi:hypothetical protein